ncbi:MAG: hypothetical protein M0Q91_13305 [Methanoregula sp.]|jgi:hypothetical protein|nr:hypothetical protein [Methanoregula sp.]
MSLYLFLDDDQEEKLNDRMRQEGVALPQVDAELKFLLYKAGVSDVCPRMGAVTK